MVRNMAERAIAISRLEGLCDTWIGPDVSIYGKVTIPPQCLSTDLRIVVDKRSFPDIPLTRGALGALSLSVRSCLAQSGVEVLFHHSDMTDEMLVGLQNGETVAIPVNIHNYSPRPIMLEDGLMRFYWVNDRRRLRHNELRHAIGNSLTIDGTEGEDWSFLDDEPDDDCCPGAVAISDSGPLKDLSVKLCLNARFHIPESDEPFCVKRKSDLPMFFQELQPGRRPYFSIGETAPVRLGPDIIAVINIGAYDHGKKHIRSPLIDPLYSGKIRTETVAGLDYIELFLYKCRPPS
jgi:hypothetical protein